MIDVDMITSRREELVEDLTRVRLKQDEIEKNKIRKCRIAKRTHWSNSTV